MHSDLPAININTQSEYTSNNSNGVLGESKERLETVIQNERNDKMNSFIKEHNGDTFIRRLLIANNGIAAVKAIRSLRKWTYDTFFDDKLIEFIVMVTPEDLSANAEFIKMADIYVNVPGGPNNNNYANVDLIVSTAVQENVHVYLKTNFRLFGLAGDMLQKIRHFQLSYQSITLHSWAPEVRRCKLWVIKLQAH